ncbi:XdhC/CoxI family protein [Cryobacterium melibiosiphilum]|uniref:XdhC/CoxI family protein n=1 Tax=Cryobacterium melibiosiphilum TaxID=995039 RepID=A0A3A5MQJ8_9MICO|nr:XdhC/CoxI family protein [Cryobacterium melibiosiphilum]RJT88326.1 XdhC/CoxI family protein [Cryobacterium melibiosiphilum]
MREILGSVLAGWRAGEQAGLATVVRTFESAPMPVGSAMLVTADGQALGSVSGGCVEGAVYELGAQVALDGEPVLVRYGVSDDDAFSVGLSCGGIIDVFVEPVSRTSYPQLESVQADIEAGRPVGVATVIEHPDAARLGRHLVVRESGIDGDLGSPRANQAVGDDTLGLLAAGRHGTLTYGPDGQRLGAGLRVFFASYAPKPRLLVFGAIDFAAALARAGSFLGYRVTVCDARGVFATPARFPGADEVIVAWPHRYLSEQFAAGLVDDRTVVCVLTHDPKFDVPLLEVALRGPRLAYTGAMGSRRTHDDRMRRLQEAGVGDAELARLHSPLGLDLGSRTPEETAVSIVAEIIAERWGGTGEPLGTLKRRIHSDPPPGAQRSDSTTTDAAPEPHPSRVR